MENREVVIRVRELTKEYRLGVIGRDTLQHELQSWWARKRGKEDPNERIGQRRIRDARQIQNVQQTRSTRQTQSLQQTQSTQTADGSDRKGKKPSGKCENGSFLALDGVSFDVYRGERIGVIGANGAGKSTLFKILSRVTAPTAGAIGLKGRISSMLEVGTGFHGELTGRENIYLNGAILGMKRQEVTERMDEIIAFSECEEFIDTPVKRYSSGMYVKLAFAVAAHLNSEILLMDEVLAVGDMQFQRKCLDKMHELSEDEQKTILYVSHNMETIRTLCSRCLVLERGRLIFDGDPEAAIEKYLGEVVQMKLHYDYDETADLRKTTGMVRFLSLDIEQSSQVRAADGLKFSLTFSLEEAIRDLHLRFTVRTREGQAAGTSISGSLGALPRGQAKVTFAFDTAMLARGEYIVELAAVEPIGERRQKRHAWLEHAFAFEVTEDAFEQYRIGWSAKKWGYTMYPDLEVLNREISVKGL